MPTTYKSMHNDLDDVPATKSTKKIDTIGWIFGVMGIALGLVIGFLVGKAVAGSGSDSVECPAAPSCPTVPDCPALGSSSNGTQAAALSWGMTAGELTRTMTPRTSFADIPVNLLGPSNITVKSNFDSGNIYVQSINHNTNVVELMISPDPFSQFDNKTFLGRYLFRVTGAKDVPLTYNILNAGDVNVGSNKDASRWNTYKLLFEPRVSYDYMNWFQTSHTFDNKTLSFTFKSESDSVWFAFYPPYPQSHYETALATWGMDQSGMISTTVYGESVLSQPLYLLTLGVNCKDKVKMWVTGGLHPSETQGSYFSEGLIDSALASLASMDDNVTAFFEDACMYIAPVTNPDGMALGHHRNNAVGQNLNRIWEDTNLEESPEVYYLQNVMKEHGVHFYLDAHADEDHDGIFVFYAEGICAWNETFSAVKNVFNQSLIEAFPEFDGVLPADGSYDPDPPCEAALIFSDNWVAEHFTTVTGTLEMPFQDVAAHRNTTTGFGPERAYAFGYAALDAFVNVLPSVKELHGME